jgi:CubicO group peptidase (beta-lactamase class C family)
MPRLLDDNGIHGAALALVHRGEVAWSAGYGVADRSTGAPVTPDTAFGVASISKPVTAWGVMRLVEDGRLELDAPVERYLTRWRLPPSGFDHDGVTIRRLLSHTAGLRAHSARLAEPNLSRYSLDQALSGAIGGTSPLRVTTEPGSAFMYSGDGYTLLQLVIEEVSGEAFSQFMAREVLVPLGMASSGFDWEHGLPRSMATSYDRLDNPIANYPFAHKASGGLYATAPDLASFVAAMMKGTSEEVAGREVLAPDTVAMMLAPAEASGGRYGLGYEIETRPDEFRIARHGGSIRGWRTHFAALPEAGEGIVVLTNRFGGSQVIDPVLEMWVAWATQWSEDP